MSIADDNRPEEGGDDLLAAEFALGVLSAEERTVVARRAEAEPDFARAVERWEGHFAPMASAYQPVEPPASVKAALDRKLFGRQPAATGKHAGLWASLAFWRGLAAAAVAALLLAVAIPYMRAPVEAPGQQLIASLAADGSDVRYLAVYDPATGEVGLSHVSGDRPGGHDFELWMIAGANAPVSMGVIPVGQTVRLPVAAASGGRLGAGVKLAISLEPAGGSPSGLPTGPVVSAGDLFRL